MKCSVINRALISHFILPKSQVHLRRGNGKIIIARDGGAAEKLFSGHCTHDLEAAVTACKRPVQNQASHHFSVGGGQLHMWLERLMEWAVIFREAQDC